MKRLAISLPALLAAWLCSACLASTSGSLDKSPPAGVTFPTGASQAPSSGLTPSSEPTASRKPEAKTLAFGKSYTWDDGVTVTVGKPKKFMPSEFAVVEKTKDYLRFTVTVVNKSAKPVDLGLTYISVQSRNQEADHVFDSPTGLNGPPDTKVSKGKESEFHVGFGVADARDLVMEVALHDKSGRPGLLYST
jgi:hypothetical protein